MSRPFPIVTVLGQLLHRQGWTKTEFCRVTRIHERTMTEYLAARKAPTAEHLFVMADALGVDVDDLTA